LFLQFFDQFCRGVPFLRGDEHGSRLAAL
jgi:hypothetical protein